MSRAETLAALEIESRRYMAAYALFNQAVADRLGLHPTDLQCLNLLTIDAEPRTTSQIAELTGLTSGSTSRLVDRLVAGGYVTRRRDDHDRRRVYVEPVVEETRRVGAVWDELSAGWEELLAGYSDAELRLLTRHMRRTTELSRSQIERLRAH